MSDIGQNDPKERSLWFNYLNLALGLSAPAITVALLFAVLLCVEWLEPSLIGGIDGTTDTFIENIAPGGFLLFGGIFLYCGGIVTYFLFRSNIEPTKEIVQSSLTAVEEASKIYPIEATLGKIVNRVNELNSLFKSHIRVNESSDEDKSGESE